MTRDCTQADRDPQQLIGELHDEVTAALVSSELDAVAECPDAQRTAVGATAVAHARLGPLLYRRGPGDDASDIAWQSPPAPASRANAWDGGPWQRAIERRALPVDANSLNRRAAFLAHWFALPETTGQLPGTRVWVSGMSSWRRLAARGLWVEGCADNLGFSDIVPTLECEVLGLPPLDEWLVMTRSGAEAGWASAGVGEVVATYELGAPDAAHLESARGEIENSTDFFWGSIEQYRAVERWLPRDARHACGAGKTATALHEAGVESPLVFPSREEWRAWLD